VHLLPWLLAAVAIVALVKFWPRRSHRYGTAITARPRGPGAAWAWNRQAHVASSWQTGL